MKIKVTITITVLLVLGSIAYSKEPFIYRVAGHNVNLRATPNLNSKVVFMLPIGSIVHLIKKDQKKVKIGEMEGYWIYVESKITNPYKPRERYKGWVFDYYLLGEQQIGSKGFEKVVKIKLKDNKIKQIDLFDEGGVYEYQINEDGSYQVKITGNENRTEKGYIYRYRSLYVLNTKYAGMKLYVDDKLNFHVIQTLETISNPKFLKLFEMPVVEVAKN